MAEENATYLIYTVMSENGPEEVVLLGPGVSEEDADLAKQALAKTYGLDENLTSPDELTHLEVEYTVPVTDVRVWLEKRKEAGL